MDWLNYSEKNSAEHAQSIVLFKGSAPSPSVHLPVLARPSQREGDRIAFPHPLSSAKSLPTDPPILALGTATILRRTSALRCEFVAEGTK